MRSLLLAVAVPVIRGSTHDRHVEVGVTGAGQTVWPW